MIQKTPLIILKTSHKRDRSYVSNTEFEDYNNYSKCNDIVTAVDRLCDVVCMRDIVNTIKSTWMNRRTLKTTHCVRIMT